MGLYDMICKSEEIKDHTKNCPFSANNFARLRARSAGASYLQYYRTLGNGWPDIKAVKQLRFLAKRSTDYYEKAFNQETDNFAKVQISAEWLELAINAYYDADSRALRSVLPGVDSFSKKAKSEKIKKQTEGFRRAILDAMKQGRIASKFTLETKSKIARLFSLEFQYYASIGIPNDLYDALVKDLDQLFDILIPTDYVVNADMFGVTMRWYLWTAITRQLPDEIEKKFIDKQVNTIADSMSGAIDTLLAHPKLDPVGEDYKKRWLESYKQLKDNRFYPLYKKALLRHQFQDYLKLIENRQKNTHKKYLSVSKRIDMGYGVAQKLNKEYKENQRIFATTLSNQSFMVYGKYFEPVCIPLARKIITSCTGTVNAHDAYIFTVGSVIDFPEYPIKKWLTPTGD